MDNVLSDLRCAGCGAPALVDQGDGTVQCDYCGSAYAHPERVCPKCQTISELTDLDCPACGQPLRGLCPSCDALNPLEAQTCRRCGASLDLLAHVAGRVATTSADLIYQRSAEADALKRREEEASRARLEQMWQRDHERQERLAASRLKQQQQEKILSAVAAILLIVIIVGLAIFLLLTRG